MGKVAALKPQPKILGAAIATVAFYVASLFGVEIPAEVAAAAVVIVGYLVPN
jgi:hypothetical protein